MMSGKRKKRKYGTAMCNELSKFVHSDVFTPKPKHLLCCRDLFIYAFSQFIFVCSSFDQIRRDGICGQEFL